MEMILQTLKKLVFGGITYYTLDPVPSLYEIFVPPAQLPKT